jgi:tRNA nucleotidyltransferase (CCA-adding enzyme)
MFNLVHHLVLIILGPDPVRAIRLIHEANLYAAIFCVYPENLRTTFSSTPASSQTALSCALTLQRVLQQSDNNLPAVHSGLLAKAQESRGQLYVAAALSPFLHITYEEPKKKALTSAVSLALWESLKLGSQNSAVPAFYSAYALISKPDLQSERFQSPSERVAIGKT